VLGLRKDEITQRRYNAPSWRITDYEGQPFPDEELPFRRVMATGQPVSDVRHAIEWPDGRRVLLAVNAAPLLDPNGQVGGMVAEIEDVTERVKAEEALRALTARYQALLDTVPDIIAEVDANKVYTWVNRAGRQFFGESVLGKEAAFYFEGAQDTYGKVQPLFEGTADVFYVESWQRRQDGEKRLLAWRCRALKDANGKVTGALSTARDITDRKQAEAERERLLKDVLAGRERLQSLSRRLLDVREDEDRHIARELHDEIGQLITALKLTLGVFERQPVEQAKARVPEAQALVDDLMTRVRNLSLALRPGVLDDLGLLPALLWHFERYTARTEVRVDFKHTGLERRFAPQVETAAYRIVQEALTNVARHAKASEVTVRLSADAATLGIQVEDAGAGFDADAALASVATSGLAGMRERAALLGGRFALDSAPGKGTRLVAELPVR